MENALDWARSGGFANLASATDLSNEGSIHGRRAIGIKSRQESDVFKATEATELGMALWTLCPPCEVVLSAAERKACSETARGSRPMR